jgi:hypothetical protein
MNIAHVTSLSPRQIATSLGRLCRYAGRGKFCSVLLHCFVVSDFLPNRLKFFGLTHDQAEAITNDVVSVYKNTEFRQVEEAIFESMAKFQGVRVPTRRERAAVKHSDIRSRQGEIHTGVGDRSLKPEYPVRDREAEKITRHYHRKYPPSDCLRRNGRAVAEFCRRYKVYRALMKA